jgi:hypothetical protein
LPSSDEKARNRNGRCTLTMTISFIPCKPGLFVFVLSILIRMSCEFYRNL